MASEKINPCGIHIGMDISVGALENFIFQAQPVKHKKIKDTSDPEMGTLEFFHGILPQLRFIDEKYLDKWEKKQVEYKTRLVNIKNRRIESTKDAFHREHDRLLSLCGPEWYQELSPQQKEIIDHLNSAMKKDLASHLTGKTQSSLSLLGMRPLPNDSQLWRALIRSYGCPIEFLLILYELMNPHRKQYSINDRLLLSGVAHLCLRHTLHEMHVRFPSPPRVKHKTRPPKAQPPKKKYPSVYLIPFTFKWPIRSRALYKTPVVQKPECPYFSYVCDMVKERIICFDDSNQLQREDEDVKLPCELFNDHLKSEELYNSVFEREDECKYMIIRPRIYETFTPKVYPGVLPIYMLKKQYPPPTKLFFFVKIYEEFNPRNNKSRKLVKTICEARKIPSGRPGQKLGQTLIANYVYINNIGLYPKEEIDAIVIEEDSEELVKLPCSVCGGPDRKGLASELKPRKIKKYIKTSPKPKKKRVYREWSSSESNGEDDAKMKVIHLTAEKLKLKNENANYYEMWTKFFLFTEELEKLKLEAQECLCPDKTKDKSKTEPENQCTCAIWNLPPPPPKVISPVISCECKPEVEKPPDEDKCECRKNAREKAMEACGQCGVAKLKTDEEKEKGGCDCNKKINDCGNCMKKAQIMSSLPEDQKTKECVCNSELSGGGRDVTVAYVFVNNQTPIAEVFKPVEEFMTESVKNTECSTCEKNLTEKYPKRKKGGSKHKKKITQIHNTNKSINDDDNKTEKLSEEIAGNLICREKLSKLDYCHRETQKLLRLLKCSCSKCEDLRKKYRAKYIQAGTRDACGGVLPVIGGAFTSYDGCDCLEKFEEKIKGVKDYEKRMKAKLDLKFHKYRYIINGVTQTRMGPVYNISGTVPKYSRLCQTEQKLKKEKEKHDRLEEKIKHGYKYVISGVKEGPQENEYIVSKVVKECNCSKVFKLFMEEHNECLVNYERYLQYMRKEIEEYKKEMDEKYCHLPLTTQKLLDEEIRRLKGPPGLPLPEGKSRFEISGVQTNDLRKSFVLGGIQLTQKESEECVIAIQSYTHASETEGISKCQRTYLCNYMTFGRNCGNPFQTKDTEIRKSSEELICQCISYESMESSSSSEGEQDGDEDGKSGRCGCDGACGVQLESSGECSCAVLEEEEEIPCECPNENEEEEESIVSECSERCSCAAVKVQSSSSVSDPCMCGFKNCGCQIDEVCVKECFYGPMEAWWSDTDIDKTNEIKELKKKKTMKTSSMSNIGGLSERYVILREVPKKRREQEEVLKKLLRGLAKDGYPLASLPDCHKIPYFWLWLQFRMRKQWGYDDGVKNFTINNRLWNHISICNRNVPLPKIPRCLRDKNYTWRDAERIAKMIDNVKQKYYNRVRKNMVDFSREFYTTISPYQFPRPPYLNHYFFAYQPSKLENVIAEYVWQPQECKDPRDYRSCLCK